MRKLEWDWTEKLELMKSCKLTRLTFKHLTSELPQADPQSDKESSLTPQWESNKSTMLSKPLKCKPMLYNNTLSLHNMLFPDHNSNSLVHLKLFLDHNSLVHLNIFLVSQMLPLQLPTTPEEITQAEDKSSTTPQAELPTPVESKKQ